MPVEVEVHTVPHFKAPVNGTVNPWWLEYGSNFSIQTSLLKIGCLLYKLGHFDSQLLTIVKSNMADKWWKDAKYHFSNDVCSSFLMKLFRINYKFSPIKYVASTQS